ncbi:hypothetical protein V8E36_002459 [Tilletia maclaganii]
MLTIFSPCHRQRPLAIASPALSTQSRPARRTQQQARADKLVRQQQQQHKSIRAQGHVQQQQRHSARSAALGPGDSDDDCIDSDVSEPAKKTAKKMSLTNWATNTLGEMTYTYIEGNNKGYEIGEDK